MRRLRLFGPRGFMGIGVHLAQIKQALASYRGLFTAIEHFHDRVVSEVRRSIQTSLDDDINLFFGDVAFTSALKGMKIFWPVFEASRPPPDASAWLHRYDLLLSPSQWGRDCLIHEGLDPDRIKIVPEGVDPYRFHPFARKSQAEVRPGADTHADRPLYFLMMGKYETRKAYEQAFEAFDLAFGSSRDVCLLIKPEWISESRVMMAPACVELLQRFKHLSIRWVRGFLDETSLSALYARTDVFLFPSMGEGWGLPLIEALASGTPALCTHWSGQTEYLRGIEDLTWPVPFVLEQVHCEQWLADHQYSDGVIPQWAVPDVVGLAKQMQLIAGLSAEHRASAGLLASEHVRSRFSWQQSADKFLKALGYF